MDQPHSMVVAPLETSTSRFADPLLVKSLIRQQILTNNTGTRITSQFRASYLQLHLALYNWLPSELLLSLTSFLSLQSLKLESEHKTQLDLENGLDLTRVNQSSASTECPSRLKLSRLKMKTPAALLVALTISRFLGLLLLLTLRLEVRMFSHTKSSGTRENLQERVTTS